MTKLPLYLQIKKDIKTAIESGDLREGDRIPSELELAKQYGVSRNPTRQALRELELEGYLTRTRRRGSFVAPLSHRTKRLSFNQGRVVAVVCPDIRSVHVREIVEGFIHRAGERGYNAMVYFMDCTDQNQAELLSDIHHSGLAGVALWVTDAVAHTLDVLNNYHKTGYPFVLIDRYIRGFECDFVVTDNRAMAYTLTRTLVERGHKTIGFFRGDYENSANEDRLRGYHDALDEGGLARVAELEAAIPTDPDVPPYEIHRVVAHKSRPSAFFCAEAWLADRAASELSRLGYRVPGDIELAAVDDGELDGKRSLCVRTVRQQSYEIGFRAADILMHRVEHPHAGPTQLRLDCIENKL